MPKPISTPRERGILYDAAMVGALLEDRKTQTRRVFVDQPRADSNEPGAYSMLFSGGSHLNKIHEEVRDIRTRKLISEREYLMPLPEWLASHCPLGRVGDRLYVRETWGTVGGVNPIQNPQAVRFRADGPNDAVPRWRPSIHLPRSLSRITLAITAVRAERVQDLTEEDAIAEGIFQDADGSWTVGDDEYHATPRMTFAAMWDRTNASSLAWEHNPWTSVVTFEVEVATHG